jgi:hypothetical protein
MNNNKTIEGNKVKNNMHSRIQFAVVVNKFSISSLLLTYRKERIMRMNNIKQKSIGGVGAYK